MHNEFRSTQFLYEPLKIVFVWRFKQMCWKQIESASRTAINELSFRLELRMWTFYHTTLVPKYTKDGVFLVKFRKKILRDIWGQPSILRTKYELSIKYLEDSILMCIWHKLNEQLYVSNTLNTN